MHPDSSHLLDFMEFHREDIEHSALLAGTAPTRVCAEASNRDHAKYLTRMSFTERPGLPGRYQIQLVAPAPGAAA